ncbi:MAG TPA: xanthine dehydrogenase family protein molybdopterin-binding subunit [Acidimicrobiales bacterium]|nr:xanthine dehydrogenase family protein molybdopterin-binding subunit [Acidimicrobiales bacterium]
MSILGNRVLRKEDPKFLTVGGTYVDDVRLTGALHLAYVRSPVAHARVRSIDAAEALASPGVVAVHTAADVDLAPMPPGAPFVNMAMSRPWLAETVVRFVGDLVAMVVAESREEAVDAAELVVVDYEPLPVVVGPEEAVEDRIVLFPEAGTNLALKLPDEIVPFGMAKAEETEVDPNFFDGCEVVVRQRIVNQRVAPCPLEVRAAASVVEDGRLTHWSATQAPHGVKTTLAQTFGLDESEVHVIAPDVGGGFGAKMGTCPEELLVPWVARQYGRPARWVETRMESMMALGHGRAQIQDVEIGGTREGEILAYRLAVLQDAGAYPNFGALLPMMTRMMLTGVYEIPKFGFTSRSVVTNTNPVVAYRGAGRPEASAAIERAVDLFATEIGMDPAQVRRRNLIKKDAFPYTTPTGSTYDSGDYERCLDMALAAADYPALRAEQARRRQAGDVRQLGIGLATYVEITNGVPGSEFGSVEVRPDGTARVLTGTSPHGQGHETAWSMIVADHLGISVEDVEVVHGDTDLVPRGVGTFGSKSLQSGGVAVHEAAGRVVEKATELASELLEANPDDVVLDKSAGRFHVVGNPTAGATWGELASAAGDDGLSAESDFTAPGPTFPFGTHLVVAEVDTETGMVRITRVVTVDDAGTILNPLLAEGQIHGGIAQGVAQALLEEVIYDDEGNLLTSNLADYTMVSATELPSFETTRMETPTPLNPLGAKGIGEAGTIGATPAVQNAVVDALTHLGVRHVEMPTTPLRVWRALSDTEAKEAQ